MEKTGIIEAEWETYRRMTIPPDAPPIQLIEMRRAFYFGANALMHINQCIGEPDISEDAGLSILSSIRAELDAFLTAIQEDRA